ncbi:hypothetical protein CIK05_01785 [Bdellovibrio sp. qaytius]|nr:hypothetical protein CIK05_01785 [Bdellovibrio sp. qaytius]
MPRASSLKKVYSWSYMKYKIILVLMTSLFLLPSCQTPQNKDSVVDAQINSSMNPTEKISPMNAEFLIQMADARMMDLATGELAEKRGAKKAVKDYGRKMVLDQEIMLEEIRSLAQMNGVTLPKEISDDKKSALKDLKKLKGRKFDKQFMTLIQRDHERDIRKFSDVKVSDAHINDPAIGAYAKNRLPMIEEHLAQVIEIQKKYK